MEKKKYYADFMVIYGFPIFNNWHLRQAVFLFVRKEYLLFQRQNEFPRYLYLHNPNQHGIATEWEYVNSLSLFKSLYQRFLLRYSEVIGHLALCDFYHIIKELPNGQIYFRHYRCHYLP